MCASDSTGRGSWNAGEGDQHSPVTGLVHIGARSWAALRLTLSRPGPGTSTKHLTVLRGQAAISDSCGPGHQRVVEDAPFDTGVEDPDQAVASWRWV
jgi:hypothetical protein